MTIRTRLTLVVCRRPDCVPCSFIGLGAYREIDEQLRHALIAARRREHAISET